MGAAEQLELNKGDNIIFLGDISRSMSIEDCPGGLSRSNAVKEGLKTFAVEASKYDTDGLDFITFGAEVHVHPKLTADSVAALVDRMQPNEGATYTDRAIEKAWELHKAGNYDQTVAMIATDGAPTDPGRVKTVIRDIAKKLAKPKEFAISFLTVGVRDQSLQQFLTELDDDLKAVDKDGKPIDIVDVKEFDKVNFAQAFDGALND